MSIQKVIFAVGVLIAISVGSAIMLTNHYEVAQPFNPMMFSRLNRWTGHVELCSSIYDQTTYCGPAMYQRNEKALAEEHAAENQKFLSYGYTQEEIESWPAHVLDGARNIVGNGGIKETLDEWIHKNTPTK